MKSLLAWLDHRTGYKQFLHHALYENVPGGARWRYVWGSTLTFCLVSQFITGIFLWLAYSPSSQTAWESVYYIQNAMWGGWLLRGLHHYTAQAMNVLLVVHLMQVVIDGAYKAPREINFWFGLGLLQLVLGLSLTGYLLPWDQKGYWATKVATNIAAITPFIGPEVQRLIIGGADYGHHTLTRFFALHAGVLPALAIEFTWAYPWVLLVSGTFYGPSAAPLLPPASAFALLTLAYLAVRAAVTRPWSLRDTRVMIVAAGFLSGMTAVRLAYYPGRGQMDFRWIGTLLLAAHDALPAITPAVMAALLATVLWWRGVVLSEREVGYFEVDRAFRRGIRWRRLVGILLAAYGDTRGFTLTAAAPAYLLAFFSLCLMTLSITRLLMLWEETHADPAQALAANRHSFLVLLGVVGVIFVSAAGLATAVHVEFRPALARLLRPLAPLAEALFYALFAVAMVVARALV